VYGIVQQTGGHILVYSEPRRGTTFKVYLPSAEAKIERDTGSEIQPEFAKAAKATILLVEDDELIRGLTKQMLEEHGYQILEASDGAAALKLAHLNGNRFDLVLTDVVMKNMSGPEMVRELNKLNMAPKVIFMSGYTGELIGENDIQTTGSTLLEKPFTRAALLKAVYESLK
jgi:CheY-like chemotaxis protein